VNPYLAHLARRVGDAPEFLACALTEYARSEQVDDTALAALLGCPTETLTHLRLCRMPRPQAPLFWQDVELIAARFAVDAGVLAEVTRRGQSLFHLRSPGDCHKAESSFLLAARDDDRQAEPPEGEES
jgi:hypothetical protein